MGGCEWRGWEGWETVRGGGGRAGRKYGLLLDLLVVIVARVALIDRREADRI